MRLVRTIILILLPLGSIAQNLIGTIPVGDSSMFHSEFFNDDNLLLATSRLQAAILEDKKLIHYRYDGDDWNIEQDLTSFHDASDRFISNIETSTDGSYIAYELSTDNSSNLANQAVCVQRKSEISGNYELIFKLDSLIWKSGFQYSVDISISNDGSRLVVSSIENEVNQSSCNHKVEIFHYSESLGSYISQHNYVTPHLFGVGHNSSVSISGDGSTVSLGYQNVYPELDTLNQDSGRILVYDTVEEKWKESNFRLPFDENLSFLVPRETQLSADGKTALFASQFFDNKRIGNLMCYQWDIGTWELNEERFLSERENEFLTKEMFSISDKGDLISVISFRNNQVAGSHVNIFRFTNEWNKIAEIGEEFRIRSFAKMSPSGQRLLLDDSDVNLRIYDISNLTNTIATSKEVSKVSIYPNPSEEKFYISGDVEIEKLEVYNLQGRLICLLEHPIDRSFTIDQAPSGLYFVTIYIDKMPTIIKVVKS